MEIKEYMRRKKLRGSDFASELGISHAYLCQIVSGARTPSKYVALVIESKTKGAVKAKTLRPDIKDLA